MISFISFDKKNNIKPDIFRYCKYDSGLNAHYMFNAMSSVLKVHKALLILYTVGLWSKLSPSKFGSHEKLQRQVKQKIKYASLAYFIYSFHSSNLIVQLVSGHQWTNEQHPLLNSITMIFCNMIKINSGQWQVELLLDLREPIKASDEFSFGKSACFDWGVFVENTLWPCFGVNWLFGYQFLSEVYSFLRRKHS